MEPIKFKEQNTTFAEYQEEYLSLPTHKIEGREGKVIFCMKLSRRERFKIFFSGKLWCTLLTFNKPLTPSHFTVNKKDYFS